MRQKEEERHAHKKGEVGRRGRRGEDRREKQGEAEWSPNPGSATH